MAQPVGTKRGPYKHHQPPRKCKFPGCNCIYVPENSNQHYCKSEHFSTCVVCGAKFSVKNLAAPSRTCSKKCGIRLQQQNRSDGYGELWKQKCRKTNLERRGVPYPMQSDEVKRRSQQTAFEHYGTLHPMQSDEVKDRISDTVRSRYGVNWACQLKQCTTSRGRISDPCKRILRLFELSELRCELEYPIERYRYDIHVVGTNVLIEVNPTVSHNSSFSPWGDPKAADYHRLKFESAYSHGYICFNIWDWTDAVDLLHGLLYSKSFEIVDLGRPTLHYYNDTIKQHILADSNVVPTGYFPVYDEGYSITFIY